MHVAGQEGTPSCRHVSDAGTSNVTGVHVGAEGDSKVTGVHAALRDCVGAASLARKVYMRQNVGVGAFAKQYGGRNKRKGTVPEHYARASRGLIRHILKQVTTCKTVHCNLPQPPTVWRLPPGTNLNSATSELALRDPIWHHVA